MDAPQCGQLSRLNARNSDPQYSQRNTGSPPFGGGTEIRGECGLAVMVFFFFQHSEFRISAASAADDEILSIMKQHRPQSEFPKIAADAFGLFVMFDADQLAPFEQRLQFRQ
jgi:hypothetical protein